MCINKCSSIADSSSLFISFFFVSCYCSDILNRSVFVEKSDLQHYCSRCRISPPDTTSHNFPSN
nr:MAG TPA: hypothetical protein [Caudoviricetes sp.]DAU54206.1 MAG TPA: hypothetical protein [Bacteriophage sp.]